MFTSRLVVFCLAGLLVAPAAQASQPVGNPRVTGPVAVTAASGVVKIDAGTCRTPVRYSVAPGSLPDGGSYDVIASLSDKRGRKFGSDSTWLEDGAAFRGAILPRCGKKFRSGAYTVSVKVVINDYYLSPVETRVGSTRVRLRVSRPAHTKLVVKKSPYGRAGWQWTGRLTSGGKTVPRQRIDLWWNFLGWEDYEVSKRTNRNGVAHWVSNPDGALGGINFRLNFAGTKRYEPARSATFNIAPR